jgi:hypothetical protein
MNPIGPKPVTMRGGDERGAGGGVLSQSRGSRNELP